MAGWGVQDGFRVDTQRNDAEGSDYAGRDYAALIEGRGVSCAGRLKVAAKDIK